MIKFETLGMRDVAANDPTVVLEKDVNNYDFITANGELKLVMQYEFGDDRFVEDITLPAGTKLNTYAVARHVNQILVVDGKHITGGVATLNVGAKLKAGTDGKLAAGAGTDLSFEVVAKTYLTEKAVKVRVVAEQPKVTGQSD